MRPSVRAEKYLFIYLFIHETNSFIKQFTQEEEEEEFVFRTKTIHKDE